MKVFQYLLSMLLAVSLIMACSTKSSEEEAADEETSAYATDADGEESSDANGDSGSSYSEADGDGEAAPADAEMLEGKDAEALDVEEEEYYEREEQGDVVYTFLMEDERPTFKDGTLNEFIQGNLEYPREARQNESEGTVIVDFIVGADGTVEEAQVIKPHEDELLNTEALRVVNNMPAWNPGVKDGKAVAYKYSLPIHFVLKE